MKLIPERGHKNVTNVTKCDRLKKPVQIFEPGELGGSVRLITDRECQDVTNVTQCDRLKKSVEISRCGHEKGPVVNRDNACLNMDLLPLPWPGRLWTESWFPIAT